MKILVLGAHGAVGSRIVAEARRRNHHVTAAGREVDATDATSAAAAAFGHDVVISAAFDRRRPAKLLEMTEMLLEGLERAEVPRLLMIGGAGTLETRPGVHVLDGADFNPDYKPEAQAHLDALRLLQGSDTPVEWSVVTPARGLAPGDRTGSYREGSDAILYGADGKNRISMEDFAVAIVDEAERRAHPRARFSVAY